jgi:tetratricopeptide (TPR) repeat protein
MMTRSLWIMLAVTVALAASPRASYAQARPSPAGRKAPTQKQLEQARKHFEAAEAAKSRRDYQTAAVEYLAAYEQFQEPEFFYNIAEVYRLAGDDQNALTYYEKYLELDPKGRGAATARDSAAQLRRSIAAKQDALARAAAEEEARKRSEATAKPEPPRAPEPARAPESVPAPEHPGRNLRIAGIAIGSAGVVSIAVGVAFGFKVRSIEDDIAKDTVYHPSAYANGEAAERNMILFASVGAAAIVAGGVTYYLGHRAARSTEGHPSTAVTFVPVVGPAHLALAAVGRF